MCCVGRFGIQADKCLDGMFSKKVGGHFSMDMYRSSAVTSDPSMPDPSMPDPSMPDPSMPDPETGNLSATAPFTWSVYADATLAGLSVLIPLPLVDDLFESYFRKRMVKSIAQRHQRSLDRTVVTTVNRTPQDWLSRLRSCLFLPFRLAVELVLSLSRKLLYFLSIKKAVDALNYYWQRAYLLDHMVRQGYLRNGQDPEMAVNILEMVLNEHSQSPLTQLAGEVVRSPARLVRSVRRARQGIEDPELAETKQTMRGAWGQYEDYFKRLSDRYDTLFQSALHRDPRVPANGVPGSME